MTDRADELAQDLIPEHATKIMVDTRSGDRRVYSADEGREHLVAALRTYAEEARREEWKRLQELVYVPHEIEDSCKPVSMGQTCACWVGDANRRLDKMWIAAIRARGGKG